MKFLPVISLFLLLLLQACNLTSTVAQPEEIDMNKPTILSYLALGDSYTIGERVLPSERFPVQLADSLSKSGVAINDPRIIAKTGWTTDELIAAIEEADIQGQTFDFVTLLIGVNNQYRGYPLATYEQEFKLLLNQAIRFAGQKKERVFVLSIPDYGVTPFAKDRDPAKIAREIDQFNTANLKICKDKDVHYIDITPISRAAVDDPSLIAEDLLHPSGKMYQQWVELLYEQVVQSLK